MGEEADEVEGFNPFDVPLMVLALIMLFGVVWLIRFVIRSGLFHKLECRKGKLESIKVAYKCHTGDYADCGQYSRAIVAASGPKRSIKELGVLMTWLDDPAKTPQSKTRYIVGLVLLPGMRVAETRLKEQGYEVANLPAARCGICRFPNNGFISVMLALQSVFVRLGDLARKEGIKEVGPFFEVTWLNREITDYYVPLEKMKEFRLGRAPPDQYLASLQEDGA